MEKELVIKEEINLILPHIIRIGANEINFSYDTEVDVMYISLGKKQKADKTDDSNYPTIYRYVGSQLIGITIINYSKVTKERF